MDTLPVPNVPPKPYRQTEAMRLYLYVSAPFARVLNVACVWCGQPAGQVNLLDVMEPMLWIKSGKLCPPCYERQMEADVC